MEKSRRENGPVLLTEEEIMVVVFCRCTSMRTSNKLEYCVFFFLSSKRVVLVATRWEGHNGQFSAPHEWVQSVLIFGGDW